MKEWYRSVQMSFVFFVLTACGQGPTGSTLKREWDYQNAPERMGLLSDDYVVTMADLPKQGKLTKKPWSGGYWPSYLGGISYRWFHSSHDDNDLIFYKLNKMTEIKEEEIEQLSPSEKYDLLLGDQRYSLTKNERERTRVLEIKGGHQIPHWFGLCHAWAPATLLFDNPKPVVVTSVNGKKIPFGSSDIKALLTYFLHQKASRTSFVSRRCNVDEWALREKVRKGQIPKSEYDRIMDSKECRGINAGAFHVILANMIALKDRGFIADLTRDLEVWNQAIYGYRTQVLAERTNGLSRQAAPGTVKEVKVRTTMTYIVEIESTWELTESKAAFRHITYDYWLELDKKNQIIGGSWISFDRPDFLWNRTIPEFDDYFEPLKQLYLKSIGVDTHSEEDQISIVHGKIHGLKWKIKKQFFSRVKANVTGRLETQTNQLKLVAKDQYGQTLNERVLTLDQSGSFKGTLSFNKRLVKTLYLIGLDEAGNEILVVQKDLSS